MSSGGNTNHQSSGSMLETALLHVLGGVYSSDRPRLVYSLRHRRLRGPAPASAVRVRCDSHTANVDPLLPRRQDPVCQAGAAQIISHPPPCWLPHGPIYSTVLFAVYYSPVTDVIASHGIQHHQYADDIQLRLAMHADNTSHRLAVLALLN